METNLEILQREFDALTNELDELDQRAAKAMAGIGGKDETKIDLFRWRQRKNKLGLQLPIIESKLLQEQITQLKLDREKAKSDLETLRPRLEAAAADYDQKLKALQESFERHGMLQARAFNLDQTVIQSWEEMQDKKRTLRSLIEQITGVREVRPSTDNLLIRH